MDDATKNAVVAVLISPPVAYNVVRHNMRADCSDEYYGFSSGVSSVLDNLLGDHHASIVRVEYNALEMQIDEELDCRNHQRRPRNA